MKKFLRGVFNEQPPIPKPKCTWDVNIVLDYFVTLGPNDQLQYLQLAGKCALLLMLATMCRLGDIMQTDLTHMKRINNGVEFHLSKPTKTFSIFNYSRANNLQKLTVMKGNVDQKICPIACLESYIERTKPFRRNSNCNALFIVIGINPHKASNLTVGRWVKNAIKDSGIAGYSSHSARSSSSSFLALLGMGITDLVGRVGWGSESTFVKTYLKPIFNSPGLNHGRTLPHSAVIKPATKPTSSAGIKHANKNSAKHFELPKDRHNYKSIWSSTAPRLVSNNSRRFKRIRQKHIHTCTSSDPSFANRKVAEPEPANVKKGKSVTFSSTAKFIKPASNGGNCKNPVDTTPAPGYPSKIVLTRKRTSKNGIVSPPKWILVSKNKEKLNAKNKSEHSKGKNSVKQLLDESDTISVTSPKCIESDSDQLSVMDIGVDEIKEVIQNSPPPKMFDDEDFGDISSDKIANMIGSQPSTQITHDVLNTPLFENHGLSTVNTTELNSILGKSQFCGQSFTGGGDMPNTENSFDSNKSKITTPRKTLANFLRGRSSGSFGRQLAA